MPRTRAESRLPAMVSETGTRGVSRMRADGPRRLDVGPADAATTAMLTATLTVKRNASWVRPPRAASLIFNLCGVASGLPISSVFWCRCRVSCW
jgi:hypothetical protein